jgi:hypothetical protein
MANIAMVCPSCGAQIQLPPDLVGKVAKCLTCNAHFIASPGAPLTITLLRPYICPKCSMQCWVPPHLVGGNVKCTVCKKDFHALGSPPVAPTIPTLGAKRKGLRWWAWVLISLGMLVVMSILLAVFTVPIEPITAKLTPGAQQQFTSSASGVTWTATGGRINNAGLFTAGSNPGEYSITASAGGKTGTATVTITAPAPVRPTENLGAVISADGVTVTVANLEEWDWTDVKVELNIDDWGGGGFEYNVGSLENNKQVKVGLLNFSQSDGTRFNPYEKKLKNVIVKATRDKVRGFRINNYK